MKINLVAVGKIKEKYFTEAIAEYAKRMSRFADFKVVEIPEYPPKTQSAADIDASLAAEAKRMLQESKGYVIATAIDGEMLSSEELATLIDKKCAAGYGELTFLIGGSNGMAPEVLKRADKRISFGRVTYPHQLMRVILSEQIYRALSILNNLPYHK